MGRVRAVKVFDDTACALGEGALWHPTRQQFFWFDILGKKLLTQVEGRTSAWDFDEMVSAAGWIDDTQLLIASQTKLFTFDLETSAQEDVIGLEADNTETRSNDGRADPWGGFWISTMGIDNLQPTGAFYRYYKGELRELFGGLSIPNACCFSPDRDFALFTDTAKGVVLKVALDPDTGWPSRDPEPWLDLNNNDWGVDGAVIDADGNFWNAQWGGWRVACYAPDGTLLRTLDAGAAQTTCPAFGGADLTTLYLTSATMGASDENLKKSNDHGKVFIQQNVAKGQAEHRVFL